LRDDLKEVLFSEEVIRQRVKELAARITQDYSGKSPLLVGVLKGCFMFLADLSRGIELDCEIRFLTALSYGSSTVSSGNVTIKKDFDFEIEGRDVILVEDILDSGVTLTFLSEYISGFSPASLRICTLLDKPSRRKVPLSADYTGFECPDEFVVGYGLDFAERYRHLPFVATLKPEVYS